MFAEEDKSAPFPAWTNVRERPDKCSFLQGTRAPTPTFMHNPVRWSRPNEQSLSRYSVANTRWSHLGSVTNLDSAILPANMLNSGPLEVVQSLGTD
jgi:hypothetical protein